MNDQLQTSDPDIFAVGDVIEVTDFVNGRPTVVPLAWPANRQGRLVADHLNGMDVRYKGTMGTSVAKVFELTVAAAGNNEKSLNGSDTDYKVVHIHPNSHAGYYPGASPLDIKLLFGLDGKILGVQAVGMEGVEKRVDVIATAMKLGATVYDLPDLELAYAPPYSSAKDPANIAGYVASNILEGTIDTFQWHEVDGLIAKGAFLLDVREDFELATGVLGNAYTIPLGDIRARMSELPKDKTIYVFCQVGHRGYNAARILMQNGFTVKNLDGGYKTYKQAKTTLTYQEDVPEAAVHVEPTHAKPAAQPVGNTIQVDACGLQCPGPILKVKENMDKMVDGQELIIEASDFGFLGGHRRLDEEHRQHNDLERNRRQNRPCAHLERESSSGSSSNWLQPSSIGSPSGTSAGPAGNERRRNNGRLQWRFGQSLGFLHHRQRSGGLRQASDDVLHFLGLERHQASGKSQRSQTRHGKNVRHHVAEPRRPIADLENEHERRRIENDPSCHETKERRQPAGHDRASAKNGRQDGSLHNVHGHHGHQRRRNHRRRGLRRCSNLHRRHDGCELEPIHLIKQHKYGFRCGGGLFCWHSVVLDGES